MENINKVKSVLDKYGIEWELGSNTGWSNDSLIFDGGDCKILVYVKEDRDKKGGLFLSYFDLFQEGEYSPIFDRVIEETTTSHRGYRKCVSRMLKDIGLIPKGK
jgi:hypothetical protein